MKVEFAIVGAGAVGLSTAWRLAAAGREVLVVSAPGAAPRASLAAAGMLAPSFEGLANSPVARAAHAYAYDALAAWPGFAADLDAAAGQTIDYRSNGVLGVAQTAAGRARLEAVAAQAGDRAQLLDGAAVRDLEPGLALDVVPDVAPDGAIGLFASAEGQVDPVRLTAALEAACRAAGVVFMETALAGLERLEGSKGQETILRGASGDSLASARGVVLATGAAPLKALAGGLIGSGAPIVQPVKGEALALSGTAGLGRVIRGEAAYLCPKSDGRLVVGASEIAGRRDILPEASAIEGLAAAATALCPGLQDTELAAQWAGVRPGTRDGAPILGPAPGSDGALVYALGHYRNGILLAPHTGGLIAEWLLRRDAAAEAALAPFSAGRFGQE